MAVRGKGADGVARRPALRLVSDRDCASPATRHVKAVRIALDDDASLDEAVTTILSGCLDHFAANAPGLAEDDDPEALHQLRVALRRLRVLLGLLQRVATAPAIAKAAIDAKALASAFGPARDWRLLHERLTGELSNLSGQEPGFDRLVATVGRRAQESQESARAALGATAAREFLAETRALLQARIWRDVAPDLVRKGSARVFAFRQLSRLHKRAARSCKNIGQLSPARRHDARIALKKARYASEFFGTLFDEERARAYLERVEKAQEKLGEDNDWTTAGRLLAEIERDADGETRRAIRAVLSRGAEERRKSLDHATKSAKRLRDADRFWL